jgi:hypothetical protein
MTAVMSMGGNPDRLVRNFTKSRVKKIAPYPVGKAALESVPAGRKLPKIPGKLTKP